MKKRIAWFVSTLTLALASAKPAAAAITFTYQTIDFPGATSTLALGINNSGQIVGGYQLPDGSRHGFLYSGGIFTTLDDPNATSGSEATGINNLGRIVGGYDLNTPGDGHVFDGAHGFLDAGGAFTEIDFPSAVNTTPHKINDRGGIVGVYRLSDTIAHGFTDLGGTLAMLDVPGTYSTQDNGINWFGKIVGRYKTSASSAKQGFLFSGGTFSTVDYPAADSTVATDIDYFGDIVGFYSLSGTSSGFLDAGGSFYAIDVPGAVATEAYGMNDQGDIVGVYVDTLGEIHGFEASFTGAAHVSVDIRPTSCPNPINIGANGILTVAILGTASFDVTQIDPTSVALQGVPALRAALQDVATPYTGAFSGASSCTTAGPDGFTDLVLSFSNHAVAAALGNVTNGQVLVLTLTGNLLPQFGGTAIIGQDVVVIVKQ